MHLTNSLFKTSYGLYNRKTSILYPSHIPTNKLQKFLLAVGSSAIALINPLRDDMVAVSSEVLGTTAIRNMYNKMKKDEEGRIILKEKPIINSTTIDLNYLETLPPSSLGYQYVKFLKDNNITCDSRKDVKFVDDVDLAYVILRYRQIHDFVHLLVNMPITVYGEILVKWIEAQQTNLPMCWCAAMFGSSHVKPNEARKYLEKDLWWAIKCGQQAKFLMNVYYEKRWNQNLDELRKSLNIIPLI